MGKFVNVLIKNGGLIASNRYNILISVVIKIYIVTNLIFSNSIY